jgi:hypothetical protein
MKNGKKVPDFSGAFLNYIIMQPIPLFPAL